MEGAQTVERIFREYRAGYSLRQIQEGLIADKRPTASGLSGWSAGNAGRLIGGVPDGSGMAVRKSCGGVSADWNPLAAKTPIQ
ncbi:MAG: recombinase family protein [Christensenellales bacterium]